MERTLSNYGAVAMLFLAGLGALFPAAMSWLYIIAFMVFELWLLRRIGSAGSAAVQAGEPPYRFAEPEAELVTRYRYYFMFPAEARAAGSVLAALGLTALVLAPWLIFRHALVPAALVACNLLAVGALTKRISPVMVLRIAANRGDRKALDLLAAHETAWEKIRLANAAEERVA
ncbi:MAG: hypothetical protein ACM30H_05430 [Clostridia bacterium]